MPNNRCTQKFLPAIMAIAAGLHAASAIGGEDIIRALNIERHHAVLVNEGDSASFEGSAGIVINQWARRLELPSIGPIGRDVPPEAQLTSALLRLDSELDRIGATRASILRFSAFVHAGEASEAHEQAVAKYFGETMEAGQNHPRLPYKIFHSDDLLEHGAADSRQRVVLNVTILDPRTATADHRADPAWDYQASKQRTFILQSIADGAVAGPQARRSERDLLRDALQGMSATLARISASSGDINELTVYFDPERGATERHLRSIVEEFFLGALPLVEYVPPQVRFLEVRTPAMSTRYITVAAAGSVTHYQ